MIRILMQFVEVIIATLLLMTVVGVILYTSFQALTWFIDWCCTWDFWRHWNR